MLEVVGVMTAAASFDSRTAIKLNSTSPLQWLVHSRGAASAGPSINWKQLQKSRSTQLLTYCKLAGAMRPLSRKRR